MKRLPNEFSKCIILNDIVKTVIQFNCKDHENSFNLE